MGYFPEVYDIVDLAIIIMLVAPVLFCTGVEYERERLCRARAARRRRRYELPRW